MRFGFIVILTGYGPRFIVEPILSGNRSFHETLYHGRYKRAGEYDSLGQALNDNARACLGINAKLEVWTDGDVHIIDFASHTIETGTPREVGEIVRALADTGSDWWRVQRPAEIPA